MNQTCQIISNLPEFKNSVEQMYASVILNKDQWLGECLDDYLFKLCGTDQVVWIPSKYIHHSDKLIHAFEACIPLGQEYCCASLVISNTIRMCLIDQHPVQGQQLLPYLVESI